MLKLPRPLRSFLSATTAFGLRRSAAVVFLGARTRDYAIDRYDLSCPTAVIPPGCGQLRPSIGPPATLKGLARNLEGKVVISYVGNMGSMHEGTTLAEAIRRTLGSSGDRCAVVISTRGDRAEQLIGPLTGLTGVTVLEHLDADEWTWLTHRTDIALTSLDARAGLVSLPSKVFSSIAGGAAIFAVAPDDSDLAGLVRALGVGIVTSPGNSEAAAAALRELVDDTEARQRYAQQAIASSTEFTPDRLATRWRNLFAQMD
jgi:colanic acid biosynthesis glycosyl transferase WcaI